ncbi:MAG: hypothetical protein JNK41_09790 [Saprospiraceae bacterium]|jgi:hypothetical protein|nr:hypothetical protein [Saprospiraceae bacterium]
MRYILIAILSLSAFFVEAQQNGRIQKDKKNDRIESLRIAFITEKLRLSPKESQLFWPVFNSYREESNQIKSSGKFDRAIEDMSESEAEDFVKDKFSQQERQLALDKKYYLKFREVLSVKKIALLYDAENEFKRKLLNAIKNRQEQGPKKRFFQGED